MTETEKILFAAIPANEFNTYWVPCTWFIYRYPIIHKAFPHFPTSQLSLP
jgi:hypothetical protein